MWTKIVRLATKRSKVSETGVPCDKDGETEVPGAKLVMPEIMGLRSAVAVDRVSETGVRYRNSTGSKEHRLESLHILTAE